MPLTKTRKGTPLTNNRRRIPGVSTSRRLFLGFQYHIDNMIKIVKFERKYDFEKM